MRVIFVFQKLKVDVRNGAKSSKNTFVSQVTAFELVDINFQYYEENTCHRPSMC